MVGTFPALSLSFLNYSVDNSTPFFVFPTGSSVGNVFHTEISVGNVFHTEISVGNVFHTETSVENVFHTETGDIILKF